MCDFLTLFCNDGVLTPYIVHLIMAMVGGTAIYIFYDTFFKGEDFLVSLASGILYSILLIILLMLVLVFIQILTRSSSMRVISVVVLLFSLAAGLGTAGRKLLKK